MDLTNVEKAMVTEMNRCFEGIKNTQVGSKEHVMATNDIAKLYSAMAAANHNSETVRVQAEKNEAESILKDEDQKARAELDKEKLEFEKQRLDLEADRIRQEFALKEVQNKTNLIDIYVDGATALAGVVVKGVIFCGAMGAILSFEKTGAVTTKTFSWLGKVLF